MSDDTTIGCRNILRLKNDINVEGIIIKRGSIGITGFEPYSGGLIRFETKNMRPKNKSIMIREDKLKENRDFEYVFKNINSLVRIQHIRDDLEII